MCFTHEACTETTSKGMLLECKSLPEHSTFNLGSPIYLSNIYFSRGKFSNYFFQSSRVVFQDSPQIQSNPENLADPKRHRIANQRNCSKKIMLGNEMIKHTLPFAHLPSTCSSLQIIDIETRIFWSWNDLLILFRRILPVNESLLKQQKICFDRLPTIMSRFVSKFQQMTLILNKNCVMLVWCYKKKKIMKFSVDICSANLSLSIHRYDFFLTIRGFSPCETRENLVK